MAKKIRYAVVGLGHFAQDAILPAFKNAKNSELVALVSGTPTKEKQLAKKYGVRKLYGYEQFDELLKSGEIDAVYLALPNDQHRDFAVRAAEAGIHVLTEKPMGVTVPDAEEMIRAAKAARIRLMVAYRLHFEEANLKAIDLIEKKKIGDPRIFNSVFSFPIAEGNIRTRPRSQGGGPLHDIGVYCINAMRYLFQDEPESVFAHSAFSGKSSVKGPDSFSVSLKFPNERLASFTVSYGAATTGFYEVIGTKGDICLDNAYEYKGKKTMWVTVKDKTQTLKFKSGDQIAPELLYFSDCILKNREPEPSGLEGLADLRVIEAILRSAETGLPVKLSESAEAGTAKGLRTKKRPSKDQEIKRPAHGDPEIVDAQQPHKDEAA